MKVTCNECDYYYSDLIECPSIKGESVFDTYYHKKWRIITHREKFTFYPEHNKMKCPVCGNVQELEIDNEIKLRE